MGIITRRPRRQLAIAAIFAIAASAVVALNAPASAGGYVVSTLDTSALVGDGPQNGTLPNGVSWTVDKGHDISPPQGYTVTPAEGIQTYTFSEPVQLEATIAGLNCFGEAIRFQAGTSPVSVNPNHSWNAGTLTVVNAGSTLDAESTFKSDGPVTSFTMDPVNAPGCYRGIRRFEVSVFRNVAPTATITTPAEGAIYYEGQNVLADYSCTDADNVPADVTCTGPVPDGSPVDTATSGDKTFTVNASDTDGGESSATATYKVVPVQGKCSGTAVDTSLLRVASANPDGDPCVTRTSDVVELSIPLGAPLPPPLTAMSGSITLELLEGTSTKAGATHSATATVSEVDIKYPLKNWTFNLKNLFSSAEASMSPDGCDGAPALTGNAEAGAMTVNGKLHKDADRPSSLPLAGLGTIRFNDVQQTPRGVSARALWVDLPGTLLDVVVAESKAAVSC